MSLHFTSQIGTQYRNELERLLYFNPLQHRYHEDIQHAIEEMGVPQIVEQNGFLRICLANREDCQSIFALAPQDGYEKVAGVIVYQRENMESLLVLHIVVDDAYTMHGVKSDDMLTFKLIDHVKRVARSIKGIKTVRVIYGRKSGRMIDLPVIRTL